MRILARLAALAIVIGVIPDLSRAAGQREPVYMDQPLSHWIESVRKRDAEMPLAFAAIKDLGPEAEKAIPELVGILTEPFAAIWVGVDSREQISAKVANIQLRAEAVEALGAIGESAASVSPVLIRWGLAVRVIPVEMATREDEELFIDLIAVDILERMRVAGAVAMFGKGAFMPIAVSLASGNGEERKLAVAILSEHAAPIAASLLKSENCESRKLGIAILTDMWPVISADHLKDLKTAVSCDPKTSY
jgi:hypothetical protein